MSPTTAPPGQPAPKFAALNYLRLAVTLGTLFAPMVGLAIVSDGLGAYELTGWFGHLLLAVPATLACGAVLWPPNWLLWRRASGGAVAVIFSVLYTPFLGWQTVSYLDVALDRDPGRTVQVRYVRHELHQKGPSYDVVTSWRDPSDTVSFHELPFGGGSSTPGAPVSLVVHRGWLGLEWVARPPG